MRTGLIGQKVGMSRVFRDDGRNIPVTVLKVDGCQVVGQRTLEKDGYTALRLGFGKIKPRNVNRPEKGQFKKAKVEARRKIAEFRVSEDALVDIGAELSPNHFVPGQFVDVSGTSIGKGFAGGIKRHNFAGLRASHGVSVSHRSLGSTGQCQDPGKVFKGKKMAGHLGDERVTVQNLEVVGTDPREGLVYVKGAVPGAKGGFVLIYDAVKKELPEGVPLPAGLKNGKDQSAEGAPEQGAGAGSSDDKEVPQESREKDAKPEEKPEAGKEAEAKAKDQKPEEKKAADKDGTEADKKPASDAGDKKKDEAKE